MQYFGQMAATTLLTTLAWCLAGGAAWAQPIELPKGSQVTVEFGEGTEIEPGTRIQGRLTRCNDVGIGFATRKGKLYWVKWSHVRSVNGTPIEGYEEAPEEETPPPRQRQKAKPKPARIEEEVPEDEPPKSAAKSRPARVVEEQPEDAPPPRRKPAYRPPAEPVDQLEDVPPPQSKPSRRYSDESPSYGGREYRSSSGGLFGEDRKIRFFGALDVFFADGAGTGIEEDVTEAYQQLTPPKSCSVATGGGIGFRGGAFYPLELMDVGGSLGYIVGPNTDASLSGRSGGQAGTADLKREVSFFRVLLEARKQFLFGEKFRLGLGAGMGTATGFAEEKCSATGSLACTGESKSWTGFTWEISPTAAYRVGSSVDLSFGLRFAGFPPLAKSGTMSKLEWNTLGLQFGVEF